MQDRSLQLINGWDSKITPYMIKQEIVNTI